MQKRDKPLAVDPMQKRDKPRDGILELLRAFTICVDMLKGLRKI